MNDVPIPIIDVNVNLSRWPARRLPGDETPALVSTLRRGGVVEAWAGSFDGLLHRDLAGVNARLAAECRRHGEGLLVPFGEVNPALPDWREDLRRCHEEHRMPGIRLHPGYHGYTLADPAVGELLDLAASSRLIVQLAVEMEDERMQHPLMRAPPVDTTPLAELVAARPGLRLVILNGLRGFGGDELRQLVEAGEVHVEIAMLEGVGGVSRLLETVPLERVLFGSHFPFYSFQAARLKLRESALGGDELRSIARGNAERLLR